MRKTSNDFDIPTKPSRFSSSEGSRTPNVAQHVLCIVAYSIRTRTPMSSKRVKRLRRKFVPQRARHERSTTQLLLQRASIRHLCRMRARPICSDARILSERPHSIICLFPGRT